MSIVADWTKIYDGDDWKKECFSFPRVSWGIYPESHINTNYKYFNDFVFKGKKYYVGSIVKLSKDAQKFLGTELECTKVIQRQITFRGLEMWAYEVGSNGEEMLHVFTTVSPDRLCEEVVSPVFAPEVREPREPITYTSEIPETKIGWMLYVLAMGVSVVFNDFIIVWLVLSVFFFTWRACKIINNK